MTSDPGSLRIKECAFDRGRPDLAGGSDRARAREGGTRLRDVGRPEGSSATTRVRASGQSGALRPAARWSRANAVGATSTRDCIGGSMALAARGGFGGCV